VPLLWKAIDPLEATPDVWAISVSPLAMLQRSARLRFLCALQDWWSHEQRWS